jgi:hypothetical protein
MTYDSGSENMLHGEPRMGGIFFGLTIGWPLTLSCLPMQQIMNERSCAHPQGRDQFRNTDQRGDTG